MDLLSWEYIHQTFFNGPWFDAAIIPKSSVKELIKFDDHKDVLKVHQAEGNCTEVRLVRF